ncbi:hypothetical protein IGI71_000239 [Enterococcus sp. DIV1279b]|uniref:Bpu10I family restriction endonuclease n=1 Tax=Enterococcus TaxID=1350 RepID=UPI002090B41B|nr:Bpu10I family restriction endonuclease [Enterococcus faecium]MCO5531885.1 Bpu10I family restriction endonuclease [Enterococcus faecium]
MVRGVHGEKLIAVLNSKKLPEVDKDRILLAIKNYDSWIESMNLISSGDIGEIVELMVDLLNKYKNFLDLNIIYDSPENFLYRQKGQLKIDNTVIEEFLPILVSKCLESRDGINNEIQISSQAKVYSSVHFSSSLNTPKLAGGMEIKSKDQDFSMSRKLYLKASYSNNFPDSESDILSTNLGYILAEIKTNLDKTMFQEASATARDVKMAVTGARYFLLCDFLDMTPISSSTTYIDEIIIFRKAKRLPSNKRSSFATYEGRMYNRDFYEKYLYDHPYDTELMLRFVNYILKEIANIDLVEDDVIDIGYF